MRKKSLMNIEKNPLTHQLSIWLATTADGTQYTCPMHSQILQSEPGFCSICGMALEPVIPATIESKFQLTSFSSALATDSFSTI